MKITLKELGALVNLILGSLPDKGSDELLSPLMATVPAKSNDPSPATSVELVTASVDYTPTFNVRGISFATAGTLKVDTIRSTGVIIPSGALAAGIIHPIEITKVYGVSTAASIVVYG